MRNNAIHDINLIPARVLFFTHAIITTYLCR
jgi:hypothetical protein